MLQITSSTINKVCALNPNFKNNEAMRFPATAFAMKIPKNLTINQIGFKTIEITKPPLEFNVLSVELDAIKT
jgi:hypothetical protein